MKSTFKILQQGSSSSSCDTTVKHDTQIYILRYLSCKSFTHYAELISIHRLNTLRINRIVRPFRLTKPNIQNWPDNVLITIIIIINILSPLEYLCYLLFNLFISKTVTFSSFLQVCILEIQVIHTTSNNIVLVTLNVRKSWLHVKRFTICFVENVSNTA